MKKDRLREGLDRIHRLALDVMTTARLDGASRQRLADVAAQALALSQELGEATATGKGLYNRVVELLSKVVGLPFFRANDED